MKVLVIGSGGREHALVWKIAQSTLVEKIYAAPGNAGIAGLAECVGTGADDIDGLLKFALEQRIDLTVVGPEGPLVAGIVDAFAEKGLGIFGFDSKGSRLEGSKVWAKEFMKTHGIPTAEYRVFGNATAAIKAVETGRFPFVVKADGLAAGKGVIVAQTARDARAAIELMMKTRAFGPAGERIVTEEFLTGEEISILAVFDGATYRLFVSSQDHKRARDNDEGPNTGGMGAYAPVRLYDAQLDARVRSEIIEPTFAGMKAEGAAGAGVVYFGIMVTEKGPKVLEYNCRFGDPETQVILPLFEGDLAQVMHEAARGNLAGVPFENGSGAAACVVIASLGYPGSYQKGYPVEGLDGARERGCIVFHAGTAIKDGAIVTAGGRVLGVTGTAPTLKEALDTAYRGVDSIRFTGCFSRRDIGKKGLT
ncbi:MAG: phosphoribosylamine--glycine ligase [Candidatus Krumholzibacteriaceae bacterium]|jgi:phosphoribosylamine--glycine ligase